MHVTTLFLLTLLYSVGLCNKAAKELYSDLFDNTDYVPNIRPVSNETEVLDVKIGLKLSQLVDVDELSQILVTNVWMILEWKDPELHWEPKDYENVQLLNVKIPTIWHPDIVLYNNADGRWEMTMDTKAVLYYDGTVKWTPPASMKSFCTMDVRYFPFDEQSCDIKFGSWTYNKKEVDIHHVWEDYFENDHYNRSINLKGFYENVEWDVMGVPGHKSDILYAGSEEPFPEVTFSIQLKRKFKFYTTNLIMPLVAHAFLTITVFYLPSASKQKVPLSISILLSLTVYFLMLSDIMPSTSTVVPLLAQYLLFTMLLVTVSVIVTGITLNVHFRSAATHDMPNWIRKIFLYTLPRLMFMKRPKVENSHDVELKHIKLKLCACFDEPDRDYFESSAAKYQFGTKRTRTQQELLNLSKKINPDARVVRMSPHCGEVQDAIDGAIFIANHLKIQDECNRTIEDWKYIALVIDRLFLIIYIIICFGGTAGIICQAPVFFDSRTPINFTYEPVHV